MAVISAEGKHRQHQCTERDAIIAKGRETNAPDQRQYGAHREEGDDKGGNETNPNLAESAGVNLAPHLPQAVEAGGKHGGDGEHEGEFGRGAAFHPDQ